MITVIILGVSHAIKLFDGFLLTFFFQNFVCQNIITYITLECWVHNRHKHMTMNTFALSKCYT